MIMIIRIHRSSYQLTSSLASVSAPAFKSILTNSMCPSQATIASGVRCCYKMERICDYISHVIMLHKFLCCYIWT